MEERLGGVVLAGAKVIYRGRGCYEVGMLG